MYNGYDAKLVDARGAKKLGIEHTRNKMAGRGVLLDIARFTGVEPLDDGYAITNADLDATSPSTTRCTMATTRSWSMRAARRSLASNTRATRWRAAAFCSTSHASRALNRSMTATRSPMPTSMPHLPRLQDVQWLRREAGRCARREEAWHRTHAQQDGGPRRSA